MVSSTIPNDVLDKISAAWPDVAAQVAILRANPQSPGLVQRAEYRAARLAAYKPDGLAVLNAQEFLYLCAAAAGYPYGARMIWFDRKEAARRAGMSPDELHRRIPSVVRRGRWWSLAAIKSSRAQDTRSGDDDETAIPA